MKKTNVCPKCGGTDIVKVPGTASGSGRYCYNEVRPIHGRGSGKPLRLLCLRLFRGMAAGGRFGKSKKILGGSGPMKGILWN